MLQMFFLQAHGVSKADLSKRKFVADIMLSSLPTSYHNNIMHHPTFSSVALLDAPLLPWKMHDRCPWHNANIISSPINSFGRRERENIGSSDECDRHISSWQHFIKFNEVYQYERIASSECLWSALFENMSYLTSWMWPLVPTLASGCSWRSTTGWVEIGSNIIACSVIFFFFAPFYYLWYYIDQHSYNDYMKW